MALPEANLDKVICPDSQAKIITPELIAVWQYLHRAKQRQKNLNF